MLVFVVETALRYAWHSLLIGWETAGDRHGEFEALDNNRLKKVIRRLKRETKILLRAKYKEYQKLMKEKGFDPMNMNNENNGKHRRKKSKFRKKSDNLFQFDASPIEKQLSIAIARHKSVIVGDFFVATCWRLHFCICTVVMSLVATYQIETVMCIKGYILFM